MTTLVMHIGGPKTGTTYIQQTLFDNRKQLSNFRIGPPFQGRNHFHLALIGVEEEGRNRFYKWGKTSAEEYLEFEKSVRCQLLDAAEKYDFSYLTSEFLLQHVSTPEGVERVGAVIHGIFDRVILVSFVRRPEFLIIPFYSTNVKAGRSLPIQSGELSGSKTQTQSRKLKMWQNHFEAAEFFVFPYFESDSVESSTNKLLSCFANYDVRNSLKFPNVRINQSLTRIGLESVRILNSLTEFWPSDKRERAVRFIELATVNDEKAGLTEQQFMEAHRFSEVETLALAKLLNQDDRVQFREQRPLEFASIGQDVIPHLFAPKINDLILSASSDEHLSKKD